LLKSIFGRRKDMAKTRLSAVPVEGTLANVIADAVGDLEGLRDEAQEIVDNAQGTNFESTSRIATLEDTASNLDSIAVPDVPDYLASLPVHYTQDQRKSRPTGRATRCNDASYRLVCCVEVLQAWVDAPDIEEKDGKAQATDEAQSIIEEVQEIIDAADNCEWPGMFG
jgi:hypothetical protein